MKSYSSKSFIGKIAGSDKPNGSIRERIEGKEYLISYVTNSKLQWTMINLNPIDSVMEGPKQLQIKILWICLLILLASLLISFVFSEYLYKPISRLVRLINDDTDYRKLKHNLNEMEYISKIYSEVTLRAKKLLSENQTNQVFLREEFLRKLLTQNLQNKDILLQLERIQNPMPLTGLRVVLFRIDYLKRLGSSYNSAFDLGFSDIIHEFMGENLQPQVVSMGKGEFAVIINQPDSTVLSGEPLLDALKGIQKKLCQAFGFTVSIGLGDTAAGLGDLKTSYDTACAMLKYKLIFGAGSLIYPDLVSGRNDEEFQYPEEIEKALVSAIKLNRKNDFHDEVEELVRLSSRYSYRYFHYLLIQVALACIKQVNKIYQDNKLEAFTDYTGIEKYFSEVEDLDEVKKWFSDLFTQFQVILQDIEESKSTKTGETITRAVEYIRQNYTDPDLTVESLATLVNFSPNYFSKVFKETLNTNVSDYIAELRFERAKELLKNTDLNINDVAAQSGFININYFYYVFKKNVGLTPASYRGSAREKRV